MKYFIQPPVEFYSSVDSHYFDPYRTYTEYNYLRPGILSPIKTRHFETALELTKTFFQKENVIDFGCGDGAFIPSLAKYFPHVLGIDCNPIFLDVTSSLVAAQYLGNVELLCNNHMTIKEIIPHASAYQYGVLYLLETLEHIGEKEALYESKIRFLNDLFSLLTGDGVIVLSVPIMVGLPFLLQRIGLELSRSYREPISSRELIDSILFNNTDKLEKRWNGAHLGFNHIRLEKLLENNFCILEKRNLLVQVVYLLRRK